MSRTGRLPVLTCFGTFVCEYSSAGITRLRFPSRNASAKAESAGVAMPFDGSVFARDLTAYCAGEKVAFPYPLHLQGTAFREKVWRCLRAIPYGRTLTYGGIARRAGVPGAARAAGNACGMNPVPILIPCHRVVRADGGIGGFSAGTAWKKRLLELETARP